MSVPGFIANFFIRLPNSDIFPLSLKIGPEMQSIELKKLLEASLTKFGHSPLYADRMRLIYQNKEMPDDKNLSEFPFGRSSSPDIIEVVVKMTGPARTKHFEYREFVRSISPEDGQTLVPLNTAIAIQFASNHAGYSLSLSCLRDSPHCASMEPKFGDMLALLGGDPAVARERGFAQWTKERYSQRVLLLQIDPSAALKMFPQPRHASRSSPKKSEQKLHEKKERPTTYLDSKRYWVDGVNEGYCGGDVHSWQRYTTTHPVDVSISETSWNLATETAYPAVPIVPDAADKPTVSSDQQWCNVRWDDESYGDDQHAAPSSAFAIPDELTRVSCLTLTPIEPLLPSTMYAVLLMNSVPVLPVADCHTHWSAFTGAGLTGEDRLFSFTTDSLGP